jgi:ectoine hydroxylase-related dioxygenase (phytanoyl-CoA dioxygenase family)
MIAPDQVAQFHRDGYIALPQLASLEEVARLRASYDRIFAARAGREEGNQFDLAGADEDNQEAKLPQILDPAKYAPELAEGPYIEAANQIARALLGENAQVGVAHAILKPARTGVPTPWHQDEAYWDPAQDYTTISIWVPLQDTTIEMGCMQFIPGSHKTEVRTHQPIGGDIRVHGLECLEVDATQAIPCPLPAGGCTIHLGRTLHFAGPNLSDTPRRALILMGGLPSTPRQGPARSFRWNEVKKTARDARASQNL